MAVTNMNYNLNTVVFMVTITFLFTVAIVPIIKKLAFHIGAIDKPNSRKIHTKDMPSLGGLSIFLGFLLGICYLLNKRSK